MGKLQNKRALVTGSSSGIGAGVALAFAREGADVAINYFPSEEPDAQEVIKLIRAEGRKGLAIPGGARHRARAGWSRHRGLQRRPPASP